MNVALATEVVTLISADPFCAGGSLLELRIMRTVTSAAEAEKAISTPMARLKPVPLPKPHAHISRLSVNPNNVIAISNGGRKSPPLPHVVN
jgi:hypothetical protein